MKLSVFTTTLFIVALLYSGGCIVSHTASPVLRSPASAVLPSVGLRGFTGLSVDANHSFGGGNSSFSGTTYGAGGPVSYHGTGSTAYSGVTMSRRETSETLRLAEGMLADMGFPLPPSPDYILVGAYYGPSTDWSRWYVDGAVDVFSLFFLMNGRCRVGLDIRVFDAVSGRQLTKISENDSYRFTTFSPLPLYGHLFHPMHWPPMLHRRSNERVTVKAINRLSEWMESNSRTSEARSEQE